MAGVMMALSILSGVSGVAAMVLAVCILRIMKRLEQAGGAAEKEAAPKAAEDPAGNAKSIEQGIDNLMTYDLNTAKASRKGREDALWP